MALHYTAACCNAMQRTATHCSMLQRTATNCTTTVHKLSRSRRAAIDNLFSINFNALQHTATQMHTNSDRSRRAAIADMFEMNFNDVLELMTFFKRMDDSTCLCGWSEDASKCLAKGV